jgi:hypothetical protein
VHLDGTEPFEQDVAGEGLGALLRELRGEGEDDSGVDAGGGEQVETLGESGGDEARAGGSKVTARECARSERARSTILASRKRCPRCTPS